MRKREFGDYIQDILDSINAIEEFVKEIGFEDFARDKCGRPQPSIFQKLSL